jgi:hypothetical protein
MIECDDFTFISEPLFLMLDDIFTDSDGRRIMLFNQRQGEVKEKPKEKLYKNTIIVMNK